MRRLLPLVTIEVFVWLILLLCTFLIAKVAFSINLGNATITERIATQVGRNFLAGVIVLTWLLVWKKTTDAYLLRALGRQTTKL
ncbi:MAG: hypothetical protein WB661_05950 [Candidatus Bathyarchaeia archaeon]